MKGLAVALVAAMGMSAVPVVAREKCAPESQRLAEVTGIETQLFAALEAEDLKAWERLADPDFVAFESGQRYNRTAILAADELKFLQRDATVMIVSEEVDTGTQLAA
jgi:hypothetical protein